MVDGATCSIEEPAYRPLIVCLRELPREPLLHQGVSARAERNQA
jgi:hypothetical protein